MRIAVSCRSLEYPSGGVREYLVSLLEALLRLDARNTYVLFHSSERFKGGFPAAEEVSLECSNRLVFDWFRLPPALKRHGIDLAFFPSSNMPPGVPCKAVAAMMDLGYFHGEYRMYRLADTLYMKVAMARTARRAERLLAISNHTKRELVDILGVPGDKIDVTHLAADALYHRPIDARDVEALKARLGLERPFFLYTGNISPRKNLKGLLEAYASVRDRLEADLVVTGGLSWSQDWEDWTAALGLAGRVRRLGHVERAHMPALYAGALAFVFPSLYEGFGLPVLEAQAAGTPVVCSTAASLPEVAGDSALMVDPADRGALSSALLRVAHDPAFREDLSARGRENARRFSWDETARKTMEAFELAARS